MIYRIYGLNVSSDVPLPGPPLDRLPQGGSQSSPAREVDLWIESGGVRPVPKEPPGGHALAHLEYREERGTVLVRNSDGYLLRFYDMCDFQISPAVDRIGAYRDPSCDPRWLTSLLGASVFGYVLALRGAPSIHASAVSFNEGVIALVGGSGSGKSTLAALLCSTGGSLVTDDVLALDIGEDAITCHCGSQQLRLRGRAASLSAAFPQPPTKTIDGRLAVDLLSSPPCFRLSAVVTPRPSPEIPHMTITRAGEKESFLALAAASQLGAWKMPDRPRNHFRQSAEIVRRVPTFSALIPWTWPLAPGIAQALRSLIRPGDAIETSGSLLAGGQ